MPITIVFFKIQFDLTVFVMIVKSPKGLHEVIKTGAEQIHES